MKSPSASFPSSMPLLFLFLFVAFIPFSQSIPLPNNVSHSDEQALLHFKAAITYDPYNVLAYWNRSTSFCNWTGITCSLQRRVIELNLPYMYLGGTISPALGNLSALQSLDLSINDLHGRIPPSLGRCSSLIELALFSNRLQGSIPRELGFLSRLESLILGANRLTGRIPSSLRNLTFLITLNLGANNLIGTIPNEIGMLSKLQDLYLHTNELSGTIPSSIGNLSSLIYLYLGTNNLTGIIPHEIGKLSKLQNLYLHTNELSGTIPSSIANLSSLIYLYLGSNNLTGIIPHEIGKLSKMQYLNLHTNELSGTIPSSITNLSSLIGLELGSNNLTGIIPWELCNNVRVHAINVSRNQLHGEIPGVLSNCKGLEHLNLSHNIFQGPIPDALSKLPYLENIDLSFNFLSGSIPMSLEQMEALWYLDVSFNNLTGDVGEEFFLHQRTFVLGNPGLCGPRKYSLPACAKQGQGKKSALRIKKRVAVGVIAFILFSSVLAFIWRRKFSRQEPDISIMMLEKISYPKFSFQDIIIATNGFNEENLLGAGNFGSVFKAILEDGRVVAIKFLHMRNKEGERNFKRECRVLGKIRHRNVIRVISAFSYLNIKALVLQFACNGSLEKYLYPENDEEDASRLGFSECLNIAVDVAHAMEYLHHDCSPQVVHCDLKPSNVLLDADMTALVSDFGISRLTNFADFMDSLGPLGTSCAARGTIGYIAPEYGLGWRISIKGDVYSFGILLLEMITRKRPTDTMFGGDLNLRRWVRSAFPNSLMDVVDNQLSRNLTMEQHKFLITFIHVGLRCSHESPQDRPTMTDVRSALESLRATLLGSAPAISYLTTPILDLVSVPSKSQTQEEAISDSQSSSY